MNIKWFFDTHCTLRIKKRETLNIHLYLHDTQKGKHDCREKRFLGKVSLSKFREKSADSLRF